MKWITLKCVDCDRTYHVKEETTDVPSGLEKGDSFEHDCPFCESKFANLLAQ